jgi:membrane associated rhomboid family serine protease
MCQCIFKEEEERKKSLWNNKKAQTSLTKTGILITLLTFYAVIFIFIGYAFGNASVYVQQGQISSYSLAGSTTFGFLAAWIINKKSKKSQKNKKQQKKKMNSA